jgi:hypothetical protein
LFTCRRDYGSNYLLFIGLCFQRLVEVVVVGGKMNMILKIRKEVFVRLLEGKKGKEKNVGLEEKMKTIIECFM